MVDSYGCCQTRFGALMCRLDSGDTIRIVTSKLLKQIGPGPFASIIRNVSVNEIGNPFIDFGEPVVD